MRVKLAILFWRRIFQEVLAQRGLVFFLQARCLGLRSLGFLFLSDLCFRGRLFRLQSFNFLGRFSRQFHQHRAHRHADAQGFSFLVIYRAVIDAQVVEPPFEGLSVRLIAYLECGSGAKRAA